MKTQSKKGNYEAQSENILTLHEEITAQIGADCAGIDRDWDALTDDELEIRNGMERHALAHGEVLR